MLADPKPGKPELSPKRVLDPAYRVNAVLFGRFTVLTLTGLLCVARAGRDWRIALMPGSRMRGRGRTTHV